MSVCTAKSLNTAETENFSPKTEGSLTYDFTLFVFVCTCLFIRVFGHGFYLQNFGPRKHKSIKAELEICLSRPTSFYCVLALPSPHSPPSLPCLWHQSVPDNVFT